MLRTIKAELHSNVERVNRRRDEFASPWMSLRPPDSEVVTRPMAIALFSTTELAGYSLRVQYARDDSGCDVSLHYPRLR